MENYYQILFIAAMLILAVLMILCLIRAVKGPTAADRLVAVNMIGTMTIGIIVILSGYLGESYLLDVCLIYTLISFLAVIVLTKVFLGIYRERNHKKEEHSKEEKGGEGDVS